MAEFFLKISNAFSPKIRKISSIIIIIFFVVQTIIFLSPLDKIPKIELWDEVVSLENGMNWSFAMLLSYESSPLYSLFYYLLSIFVEDAITLYYLNHIILLLGLVFISSFVLFRISGSFLWTILSSYSFIFFGFYSIWPRVNFLTSIVILLVMLMVFKIPDKLKKVNTALFLSYVLIFLRPEFYLTFYILLIYSLYITAKKIAGFRSGRQGEIRKFISLNKRGLFPLLSVVILLILFATPVPDGAGRSLHAFGQHYSVNVHRSEGLSSDPWIDWNKIVARDFGDASSVTDAVLENPGSFLSHIKCNIYSMADFISSVFLKGGIYSFLLLTAVLLLLIRLCFLRQSRYVGEHNPVKAGTDIFILLIFMLPVLISTLVIYPRPHYILLLWSLLLVFMSKVFFRKGISINLVWERLSAFILMLLLFFVFSGISNDSRDMKLEAIRSMREIEKSREFGSVLELGGRWAVFLKTVTRRYQPIPRASISWYKKNIDTIIVTERLKKNISGMALMKIIADPGAFGFGKIKIGKNIGLLIKNSE